MAKPPKPVKSGPFLGINNRLPVDKLRLEEGAYVRDAVNVDLTEAGTFQRRPGTTLARAAVRGRSLWSAGDVGYYADGANLMKFDGETATVLAQLQDPAANLSFTMTPRGIVWTDGQALELLEGDTTRPLCIPMPNPLPVVTALGDGALPAGGYLVAFADVEPSGERSALTPYEVVDVPDGGALQIEMVPGRTRDTQVFVSACGGEVLYREATIPAGDTSARLPLVYSQGSAISDEVEVPMPAGTIVRCHHNRLLTVVGSAVFYSQPYAYGVNRPLKGYVLLDAPVTLCEPVEGGVYLATAKQTWFVAGADFAAGEPVKVGPFGAIRNTATAEPNSSSIWWFSSRGAVKGSRTGEAVLRQDANIAFGTCTDGAALYREVDGINQVILSVANATPASAARN